MSKTLPPPFPAYQGEQAHIFVSYSHQDQEQVYPEIKLWHENGYRIWYDEGIPPTSEWPREIADAIMKSSLFTLFISPNAVTSKNVCREIDFAVSKNKRICPIYLQETKIPYPLEFQMGSIQAIMKYNIPPDIYFKKLNNVLRVNFPDVTVLNKSHNNLILNTDLKSLTGSLLINQDIREFPITGNSKESHVELMPSRVHPKSSPTLLAIANDIAKQWGMNEKDIIVIGSNTLSSIPFSGLGKDRNKLGDITLHEAEWVTSEMFFTPKLFYIAQKNALPGAIKVEGMLDMSFQSENITPILPIQPWLLQYLTLEDLSNRFAFERTKVGILARLSLPLRGTDGKGRNFVVKKEYHNANNELQAVRQLPVMEVWPDFKANDWKAYYTYYSHEKGAKTFYAVPVVPGAEIELQKKPAATIGISYQSIQNLPLEIKSYKDNLIECEAPTTGSRLEQITKLNRFPEAFACFYDFPNTNLKKFETVPAGLILLEQPGMVRQADDWKIGIDFAPDITNVYYSNGRIEPRALEFGDHFIKVTDSSAPDRADTIIYRFIGGKNAVAPFMTIYHDFQIANPTEPVLRPLLDGHIFFKNEEVRFDAKSSDMYTNLKWGANPEDRKRARAFLTQLCLQCSAEAVSCRARYVSWRYSFPANYTSGDRQDFNRVWNRIITDCNMLTGLMNTPISDNESEKSALDLIIPKSTIVAFGQFFTDHSAVFMEVPFGDRAVCLHIGGDATEVAIWHENTLRWHSSIRFAWRNMLLYLFYQNPAFLKCFVKEQEFTRLFDLANTKEEISFYAQLDILLKERGGEWLKHLHLIAGEPMMIGFTQLLALSLAGLMFYVGQMLSVLKVDQTINFPAQIPNIFVGGSGGRLLNWLANGQYRIYSPISDLLKTMLIVGTSFKVKDSAFQVCASPNPRSEVAYGLVNDLTKLITDDQLVPVGVIAGERFEENSAEKEWREKLTAERLHNGLKRPASLEQFNKFLESFNIITKSPSKKDIIKPIRDDDEALKSCLDALAQKLASAKVGMLEEVRVEPLFIILLKHFIDIKIRQWTQTQQPV